MTSGRLKDLLSHARQSSATRDATARQSELSHVAPPRECDTRHPPLSPASEGANPDPLWWRVSGLPEASGPVNLDEAIRTACGGAGISPEVFRSLLSPEDVADIEGGDIPVETLRGYALSFAEGMRSARIVVREGAKPDPASGDIVITDAEIDAARKGRTGVPGGEP